MISPGFAGNTKKNAETPEGDVRLFRIFLRSFFYSEICNGRFKTKKLINM